MAHSAGRQHPHLLVQGRLRRALVGDGFWMGAAGVAVGFGLTFVLTRVLRGALFGIEPSSLPTLLLTGVMLLTISVAAAYLLIPSLSFYGRPLVT